MKAARTAAPCWVFSIVQRKDRPLRGTALQGFPTGGAGRLPGKPERNAVPKERGHHGHGTSRECILKWYTKTGHGGGGEIRQGTW